MVIDWFAIKLLAVVLIVSAVITFAFKAAARLEQYEIRCTAAGGVVVKSSGGHVCLKTEKLL